MKLKIKSQKDQTEPQVTLLTRTKLNQYSFKEGNKKPDTRKYKIHKVQPPVKN